MQGNQADIFSLAQKAAAAAGGLTVEGAQVQRRVSYKAMLDMPSDDIEALSPMLPKHQGYGFNNASSQRQQSQGGMEMRQAYGTPYDTQQVKFSTSHSKINPSAGDIDFSLPPPSYSMPPGPDLHISRHTFGPARRDSGTLPPGLLAPKTKETKPQVPQADFDRSANNSSYDLDGPEVREHRIDYGYNPSESTEVFPTPQPKVGSRDREQRRLSDYDPSAEEGYNARGQSQGLAQGQQQGRMF